MGFCICKKKGVDYEFLIVKCCRNLKDIADMNGEERNKPTMHGGGGWIWEGYELYTNLHSCVFVSYDV